MIKSVSLWLLTAAIFLALVLLIIRNYNEVSIHFHSGNVSATISGKDKKDGGVKVRVPNEEEKGEPLEKQQLRNKTSGNNSPIIENVRSSVTLNYGKN